MRLLLGIACTVVHFGCAASLTACPDTWIPFQGSCYMFAHSNLTYHEAVIHCKSHEAELVRIETGEENKFIKHYAVNTCSHAEGYWIGLSDERAEGVWEWQNTDTIASFTDWGPNEPNGDTKENCVDLHKPIYYAWNDKACSARMDHICELFGETIGPEVVG